MNPVRAWNQFWFGRVSARPLGLFRIAFGLVVLAHLGLLAADGDTWLTDAGYLRGAEPRELAGPWRISPLQWVQDPATVHAVLGAVAVIAALFTLGWHTRVVSVLMYAGLLTIHHRLVLVLSGADVMLMCTAFYIMLSPCGAAYSLDARRQARRLGTLTEPVIVPWAQRLVQFQVSIVYFTTALLKANGKTWLDGTALYYVLNNLEFRRYTFGLTESPLAINALTTGTLIVEFALAFLLWFRATRPYAALAGIALHAGIMLTVNIPIFGELMIACYLLFLTGAELDTLSRRFGGRKRQRISATGDRTSSLRGPHFSIARRPATSVAAPETPPAALDAPPTELPSTAH